ncbi:GNAT family N-acetyltransferase [Corynebacterium lowii]|uniref:Mycothiol acetyltransferase n=1 Tax=Corynebacterium lowii TaxID=1544413 RepID=A0A0Q1DZU0_9CORY|nr:GNAT family N-acetyltransferase [Corynebacterium lowii]KQB85766.1 Mycothiol acetyltransferase [Corynebacterium lowii]MDP9851068.1 GNAT superfamily N-acetyltransferase [Corynebacterium lowii]
MTIRPYQPHDRESVVRILVSAFREDPSFARTTALALSDDKKQVLEDIFRLQIDHEYAPHGVIDLVEEEGQILGVALWNRPDGEPGVIDQLRSTRQYTRIFGRNIVKAYLRERESGAYHPKFPHWYLYTLAVSPAAQGKGVGSALLKAGLERAGHEAVYLEASTPRSAKLYATLGFVPLGELPRHGAGPSELAMWRAPAL